MAVVAECPVVQASFPLPSPRAEMWLALPTEEGFTVPCPFCRTQRVKQHTYARADVIYRPEADPGPVDVPRSTRGMLFGRVAQERASAVGVPPPATDAGNG